MIDRTKLRSVRANFIASRSRWPSLRRARARAWMSCWEYHEQLRRHDPMWWHEPQVMCEATNGSASVRVVAIDSDTAMFECRLWDGQYVAVRLEGAELRRLALWLYAGTCYPASGT